MKTIFVMLFILCAVAAFGQTASVLPNQPVILQFPEHPERAEQHALASEHPLVGGGPETYTWAHGERPLWEFGPVAEPPSLGDIARAHRKGKVTAKKAAKVFEKQGS